MPLPRVLKSARPYLWPFIALNVGSLAAVQGASIGSAFYVSVALCSLASFGFLINDLRDRDIDTLNGLDRLNHATPPALRAASITAAALLVVAGLLMLAVSLAALATGFLIAVGLVLYTTWLRSVVPVATLLAAWLDASPVWLPIILWGFPHTLGTGLLFLGGVYAIMVGREVFLDVKDQAGDRAGGRRTLATLTGTRASAVVGCSLFVSGCVLLLGNIPGSSPLLWGVISALGVVTISPSLRAVFSESPEVKAKSVARWSKVGMALVPLAILLSARSG
jgi:4-hydroxybenzoate polyprenyltransferase